MEPQVKPAENPIDLRAYVQDVLSFNGAASKTCGKLGHPNEVRGINRASMEPQVKPAENDSSHH